MVRGGDSIRFWEDIWWGDSSFQERFPFPSLFRLSSVHNKPIKCFVREDGFSVDSSSSWDLGFRRSLIEVEVGKLSSLFGVLYPV